MVMKSAFVEHPGPYTNLNTILAFQTLLKRWREHQMWTNQLNPTVICFVENLEFSKKHWMVSGVNPDKGHVSVFP